MERYDDKKRQSENNKQGEIILDKYKVPYRERSNIKFLFIEGSGIRDEYPFVKQNFDLDGDTFSSTYNKIKSLVFRTREEVILANAIYINTDKNAFNHQDFTGKIKFTFRMLGIESEWSK